MPHEIDLLILQRIDQAQDVFHQTGHVITLYIFWFVAQVIPALVRDNDSASRFYQGGNLLSPPIPEFGDSIK